MRSYQGIDVSVYRDTAERANMLRIHTFLQDASRALSANVVVTSSSVGAAPSNAAYLTIGNDASLSAERAIVTTSPLTATDGGANSSWTLSLTASALDHGSLGGLADDDHTQYILANGTRPLTNAWDAGNFSITLGSIVGKSGNLTIAPASGQAIQLLSGAAESIAQVSATPTLLTVSVPASFTAVQNVMAFAGTTTSTGQAIGINSAMTNTGVAGSSAAHGGIQSVYAYQGTSSSALGIRNIAGIRSLILIGSIGDIGLRATDYVFPGVFSLAFTAAPANSIGSIGGVSIVNSATSAMTVVRYVGLGISQKAANITATTAVGIHCHDNIQMEAGDRLVFDGTATFITGTTQTAGRVSALTAGDTYLTYSTGNTQLDCFVDAAQAFHFDAGGAAGTSRCYGALTISAGATVTAGGLTVTAGNAVVTAGNLTVTAGTGQFGGLLTADVGMTATTGDITATAGDIVATAGDFRAGSDIFLSNGGSIYLDNSAVGANRILHSGTTVLLYANGGQYAFGSTALVFASGVVLNINGGAFVLGETALTHNPAGGNGIFTITLGDATLITSSATSTSNDMVDIYRSTTTGNRVIFRVRDNAPTDYIKVITNTGVQIGSATTTKVGFYGATPVVQPSAYTQTAYSTANKTHAALTSATLTDSTGGTANTTLVDVGAVPLQANINDNFADCAAQINALRVDLEDVKQLANSIIDDLQSLGLVA